jgi:hypothetical protein
MYHAGGYVGRWGECEMALVHKWMRDGKMWSIDDAVTMEQDIDVDDPRLVACTRDALPTQIVLDVQHHLQQRNWPKHGP